MTDQPCDRCKGTAIDPEHSGVEHYGDGIVRPVPEPCSACQLEPAPRTCYSCGHPWDAHDTNSDGNRSCRSVGHPKGVTCADCRTMLTTEYREQLQDERDADWFQTVWGAYTVTLADARNAFGTSAPAFFSDIHQSALASALIAYRKQQDAEKRLAAVTEAVILWRDRPGGDVGLAIALAGILDTQTPEPPAAKALVNVLRECDRIERTVRGNPTAPDFDGAYLACLGHIRKAAGVISPDPMEDDPERSSA